MNTHSSGYYSIDEEYTIIGFNDTAKEIYPNLQKGIKCYKALMGLDSPCPPCPVMNRFTDREHILILFERFMKLLML